MLAPRISPEAPADTTKGRHSRDAPCGRSRSSEVEVLGPVWWIEDAEVALDQRHLHHRPVLHGQLLVSRPDPPVLLEVPDQPLDHVPLPVQCPVVAERRPRLRFRFFFGGSRPRSPVRAPRPDPVGVVGPVAEHAAGPLLRPTRLAADSDRVHDAAREDRVPRWPGASTTASGRPRRSSLPQACRKPATRPPQRMIRRLASAGRPVGGAPLFRRPPLRGARTLVVSTQKADQSMRPSRSRSRWRCATPVERAAAASAEPGKRLPRPNRRGGRATGPGLHDQSAARASRWPPRRHGRGSKASTRPRRR